MSNIIPFESQAGLPAYLRGMDASTDDLTAHAGTGFPIISIKGKVFAVVRDGERTTLTKEVDGEQIPVPSIDVVLIKANKGTSKVFYIKGYVENAEASKPDCFSNDGSKPDANSESPQATSCAVCPHNQWGSKIGENNSKGKACQDSVRMAIATPDLINDPYLIRVPPASIKPLGEYGKMLQKRGVNNYSAVVTKIGFDMESPTPKLTFKPVGFLTEAAFNQALEVANGDVVQAILGTNFAPAEGRVEPEQTPEPAPEKAKEEKPKAEAKPKAEPKAETKPKAEPKPEPKVEVADAEIDLNLDDLNFDD